MPIKDDPEHICVNEGCENPAMMGQSQCQKCIAKDWIPFTPITLNKPEPKTVPTERLEEIYADMWEKRGTMMAWERAYGDLDESEALGILKELIERRRNAG